MKGQSPKSADTDCSKNAGILPKVAFEASVTEAQAKVVPSSTVRVLPHIVANAAGDDVRWSIGSF